MRRSYLRLLPLLLSAACAPEAKPARAVDPLDVDVYLMASCPFAHKALTGLLPVLDQLGATARLRVHHIGGVLASGALDSMYGEEDLARGRVQVCAEHEGGEPLLRKVLGCQLSETREDMEQCLAAAQVDSAALDACARGDQGTALLKKSIEASLAAHVRESPTILVNGKAYQGGYSQGHYARALCAEASAADSAFCKTPPQPVALEVTLVRDPSCTSRGCKAEGFERFVAQSFAGARLKVVTADDRSVAELRARADAPSLPFAVFGAEAERDGYGFPMIAEHVKRVAGDARFVLPLSSSEPATGSTTTTN